MVLGGDPSLTPANSDLLAGGVEFGFTFLVPQMEGDDFVSDQVISCGEILRKVGGVILPVHELLLNPASIVVLASLVNLEPFSGPRVKLITCSAPARGQISHQRAHIVRPRALGLRLPVPGEFAARHRVNDQSGVGSTRAAVYGRIRSTIDGILGGDRSDRGGFGFSARKITGVHLSVDPEASDHAVSVHGWKEGEGDGKER